MGELGPPLIHRIVNRYIGVNGGYLGDFSYRSHAEFYLDLDLDLDIDPNALEGTTRERFITILNKSPAHVQARIIRGILERFPVGSSDGRTRELHDDLAAVADELEGRAPRRPPPAVQRPSMVVQRAIREAEVSLDGSNPVAAVDRVHTALHGYLRTVCLDASIEVPEDASASKLLTLILQGHPKFNESIPHLRSSRTILRTLGAMVAALGTVRNNGTLAHPNDDLIDEPEARLAIDAAYAVITYIEHRLR